jgi:Uma2 family endonuclease
MRDSEWVSKPSPTVNVEEYLELDRAAEGKLELLNGVVVAMAGASPRHNHLVANVLGEMRAALRGHACFVFSQDQRVRIEPTGSYVYPDIVVTCDEPRFETSEQPPSLENPSVVVEVVWQSTEDHDLGAKLSHYRRVPTISEVLFIHTEKRAITLVSRQDDGSWKLVDQGPEGTIRVANVTLSLDTIYDRADELPA